MRRKFWLPASEQKQMDLELEGNIFHFFLFTRQTYCHLSFISIENETKNEMLFPHFAVKLMNLRAKLIQFKF